MLVRFSIDCRKTKTEVITTANQKKGKTFTNQQKLKVKKQPNCPERGKTRPTKWWLLLLLHDWLRELRVFFGPITRRNTAKPMPSLKAIDTQLEKKTIMGLQRSLKVSSRILDHTISLFSVTARLLIWVIRSRKFTVAPR